jgi:hypothetical protein
MNVSKECVAFIYNIDEYGDIRFLQKDGNDLQDLTISRI